MAAGDLSKEMLARVRMRLGDRAGKIWTSDATIYAFISEGFNVMAHDVVDAALYELMKVQSAVLVGAQDEYDLPSDYLRPRIVKYKGLVAVMWPVDELRGLELTLYTPAETSPFFYIWDDDLVFEVGTVTQAAAETYELWYVKTPTAVTTTVDPELGEAFFQPVEDFAVSRCMESQQEYGMAAVLMGHFIETCGIINRRYAGAPAFDGIPNDPRLEVLQQ